MERTRRIPAPLQPYYRDALSSLKVASHGGAGTPASALISARVYARHQATDNEHLSQYS